MYTHCPNCDTHFEISQEYLDVANGIVRCGKCDHVFSALENLYDKPPATPETVPVPKEEQNTDVTNAESNQSNNSSEDSIIEKVGSKKSLFDNAGFSVPGTNIKEKMERITASLSAATAELKSARKSTNFYKSATVSEKEQATDIDDSSSSEQSLNIEHSPISEGSITIDEPLQVPKLEDELEIVNFAPNESDKGEESLLATTDFNVHSVDESDIDILKGLMNDTAHDSLNDELLDELDDINKSLSDSDNSLDDELSSYEDDLDDLDSGDDLLAELEQLENDFKASGSNSTVEGALLQDADGALLQDADGSLLQDADGSLLQDADGSLLQDADGSLLDAEGSNELIAENSSKSLQEEVAPSFLTQTDAATSSPVAILGWLAGTVVLLLLFAAQYLHFNSTQLAQDPGIRPILETLCPITNCSIPLITTPRKIVTVRHDVRTHPELDNTLEIQLIFKNKAIYTQGFPLLEITFSNPLGEVVARRKFSPSEYLDNTIEYTRGLKTNQSQEINLQVVDPDPGSLLSFQFNYL